MKKIKYIVQTIFQTFCGVSFMIVDFIDDFMIVKLAVVINWK